jgi:hypothetical protein
MIFLVEFLDGLAFVYAGHADDLAAADRLAGAYA